MTRDIKVIDFTVTSRAPEHLAPIPAGQERISFAYGIAAGQDSTLVLHHTQIERAITALSPFGFAASLSGYMTRLPGWVSLRLVPTAERGHPFPPHEEHNYQLLTAALHRAGFRETISPAIGTSTKHQHTDPIH